MTAHPDRPEALAEALAEAGGQGRTVRLTGHGTRDHLGALVPAADVVLSTRALDAVVDHQPADLTITVQAGIGLATLDDVLAEHGQWLPLQPDRRAGSVGGLLATAADGAAQLGYGRPRDLVIGSRVALADGTLARARGRVVKNVAGYDVPRLMVGSMGVLGALAEVSFRLQPRPERRALLVVGFDEPAHALLAARAVSGAEVEPVLADVLCGACRTQLVVGLDGSAARVEGLLRRTTELARSAGGADPLVLEGAEAETLRARLDDPVSAYAGDGGSGDDSPWETGTRLGIGGGTRRDRPVDEPPGRDDPVGHGAPPAAAVLRWTGRPSRVEDVVATALAAGGDAAIRIDARPICGTVFLAVGRDDGLAVTRELMRLGRERGAVVVMSGPDALRATPDDVWGPPPPDHALMRRLKEALDPQGVLQGGRFVGGL